MDATDWLILQAGSCGLFVGLAILASYKYYKFSSHLSHLASKALFDETERQALQREGIPALLFAAITTLAAIGSCLWLTAQLFQMRSMKWGEFQSVWQIGVALNIAFYSFSQIRAPFAERLKKEQDGLWEFAFKLHDVLGHDRATEVMNELERPVDSILLQNERAVEVVSAGIAMLCGGLLVYSAFNYEGSISFFTAASMTLVSFSLATVLFVANMVAARSQQRRLKKVRALGSELWDVYHKAGPLEDIGIYVPRRRKTKP